MLLLVLAGFAIWGAAFNILYGALSLGCEMGWHQRMLGTISLQRSILLILWTIHLALHVGLLVWLWRRRAATPALPTLGSFVQIVTLAVAAAGLAATLVTGSLVAFLTPCAP
jgi:hypothetical protein